MNVRHHQPLPANSEVQNKVNAPAIALLVIGWLSVVVILLLFVAGLIGLCIWFVDLIASSREIDTDKFALLAIPLIAGCGFTVVHAGLIILGAMKMRQLRNYGLAVTAAVLSICSCSCLPTIFGIWALVVLLNPEVKAAFKAQSKS